VADPIPGEWLTAAATAIEAQPAGSSAAHLARVALEAAVLSGAAVCRHCRGVLVRCDPKHQFPACEGWKHVAWLSMPIGAHYCQGRSVNPSGEPVTREEPDDGQVPE